VIALEIRDPDVVDVVDPVVGVVSIVSTGSRFYRL